MIAFSERYSLDAKYFKIFIVLQWQLSLPEFVVSRVTHEDNRICKTCRYIVGAIFLADSYGKKFAQFTYQFFYTFQLQLCVGQIAKIKLVAVFILLERKRQEALLINFNNTWFDAEVVQVQLFESLPTKEWLWFILYNKTTKNQFNLFILINLKISLLNMMFKLSSIFS